MGIFQPHPRYQSPPIFNSHARQGRMSDQMIRMIILEMEEPWSKSAASRARTITDQKKCSRHCVKLDKLHADWPKCAAPLSKDAARSPPSALSKRRSRDMADSSGGKIAVLDNALRAYEDDIQKAAAPPAQTRSPPDRHRRPPRKRQKTASSPHADEHRAH